MNEDTRVFWVPEHDIPSNWGPFSLGRCGLGGKRTYYSVKVVGDATETPIRCDCGARLVLTRVNLEPITE
jgi:hypothetical protein